MGPCLLFVVNHKRYSKSSLPKCSKVLSKVCAPSMTAVRRGVRQKRFDFEPLPVGCGPLGPLVVAVLLIGRVRGAMGREGMLFPGFVRDANSATKPFVGQIFSEENGGPVGDVEGI